MKALIEKVEDKLTSKRSKRYAPYRTGSTGYSVNQLYNILVRTVNKGTAEEVTMIYNELKGKNADMHIADLIVRTGKLPKMVKNIPSLSR